MNKKQIPINKEELLQSWENDFYELVRKLSSILLVFVPILAYFITKTVLLPTDALQVDMVIVREIVLLASITGLLSLFFPWKKFSPRWFLILVALASFYLALVVKATGYAQSPFHQLFFLIIILSAFYFRGLSLLSAFTLIACGYYYSHSPFILTTLQNINFVITLLVFMGTALAAHFLDLHLKKYQRVVCEAYEELINREESLHKVNQLESIMETVGSLSHQLSQPLTVALGQVQLDLQKLEKSPPTKESLEKIMEELVLAKNLLRKFSQVSEYATEEYVKGSRILKVKEKISSSVSPEKNSSDELGKDHAA